MEKINLKHLAKLLPIIGIIIFIYIIYNIGISKILNAFTQIPIQYYLLALLVLMPRFLLFAYGWYYLCKKSKMEPGYFYLLKTYLIGLYYGNIVPGGIGGNVRIFYLKNKTNASFEKCLTNSVLDFSLLFISGLFLSLIGSIYLFDKAPELFPFILFFFCLSTAVFVILMKKRIGSKIFKFFIKNVIPKKFKDKMGKSVDALYEDIPRYRDLLVPFLVNVLIRIISGTGVFIIAQAFSIPVPYIDFIFINIISIVVIGILPISIGGIGLREGIYVLLLASYGVEPHIAFAISFSGYLVKMLIPSFIGLFLSLKKEFRLDKVIFE